MHQSMNRLATDVEDAVSEKDDNTLSSFISPLSSSLTLVSSSSTSSSSSSSSPSSSKSLCMPMSSPRSDETEREEKSLLSKAYLSHDAVEHRQACPAALKRKRNKPLIEKRRRARINDSLQQLQTIIMEDKSNQRFKTNRLEKADILEMTVDYIKTMAGTNQPKNDHQQLHQSPADRLKPHDTSGESIDDKREAYASGFLRCIDEVSSFLKSHDKACDSSTANTIMVHCRSLLLSTLENDSVAELCPGDSSSSCGISDPATKRVKYDIDLPDSTNVPTIMSPGIETENLTRGINITVDATGFTAEDALKIIEDSSISSSTPNKADQTETVPHILKTTGDIQKISSDLICQETSFPTFTSNHIPTCTSSIVSMSDQCTSDTFPSPYSIKLQHHPGTVTPLSPDLKTTNGQASSVKPPVLLPSGTFQEPSAPTTQLKNFHPLPSAPQTITPIPSALRVNALLNNSSSCPYLMPIQGQVWIVIDSNNLFQNASDVFGQAPIKTKITPTSNPEECGSYSNNLSLGLESNDNHGTHEIPKTDTEVNVECTYRRAKSNLGFNPVEPNTIKENYICKSSNDFRNNNRTGNTGLGTSDDVYQSQLMSRLTHERCSTSSLNTSTKSDREFGDFYSNDVSQQPKSQKLVVMELHEEYINSEIATENTLRTIENNKKLSPPETELTHFPNRWPHPTCINHSSEASPKTSCHVTDSNNSDWTINTIRHSSQHEQGHEDSSTEERNPKHDLFMVPSYIPSISHNAIGSTHPLAESLQRKQNPESVIKTSDAQTLLKLQNKDIRQFISLNEISNNSSALDLTYHRRHNTSNTFSAIKYNEQQHYGSDTNRNDIGQSNHEAANNSNCHGICPLPKRPTSFNMITRYNTQPFLDCCKVSTNRISCVNNHKEKDREEFHNKSDGIPINPCSEDPKRRVSPAISLPNPAMFDNDNTIVVKHDGYDNIYCYTTSESLSKTHSSTSPSGPSIPPYGSMWRPW